MDNVSDVWIVKGQVSDPDSYPDPKPVVGQTEWQFSDGPPGERGSSADYIDLEKGLAEFSGHRLHWVGNRRRFKATVDLYIELPDDGSDAEGQCADGISDTLRHMIGESQQHGGFFIDWSYAQKPDGSYTYAEPFDGPTPEEEHQAENVRRERGK